MIKKARKCQVTFCFEYIFAAFIYMLLNIKRVKLIFVLSVFAAFIYIYIYIYIYIC